MKVIKVGTVPDKVKALKKTCWSCKSELEFTYADIEEDEREGLFIRCPVCKACIAAI